ncbi:MAG: hypothetical protein N4A35_00920, partial [Flavobacteriales bacterium]|nr:hypothetical protein [Flavobacteriales bacterium]
MVITGTCSQVKITFDHYCGIEHPDQGEVEYQLNGGSWIALTPFNYQGLSTNYTVGFNEQSYTTWQATPLSTTPLESETFIIPNTVQNDQIKIRFKIQDINNDGVYISDEDRWIIDNIQVKEEPFKYTNYNFSLPSSACVGMPLSISGLNLPTCIAPTQVKWTISDGSTPTTQFGYVPNYNFTAAGTYSVQCEILSTDGTTVNHTYQAQNITVSASPGNLTITESTTNCGQVEITFPAGLNLGTSNRQFSYGDGTHNAGVLNNSTHVHTYTANGTYTVSFTSDALSCPIYGIATVTGLPESSFTYTIPDACDYQQGINLTIANYDPITNNYQWEINGQTIGATGVSDTYSQGLQAGNNTIQLKVFSNGYSCIAQSSSDITLGTNLAGINLFSFANNNNFCQYDQLSFAHVSDLPDHYNWTITSITDGTSYSTAQYPHYILSHPETYYIRLEASINGCPSVTYPDQSTTLYEEVTVFEHHDLTFTATPDPTTCGVYTINFNHLASNAQVIIDYGDGSNPTTSRTHTYATNGLYEITATIVDGICGDSYTQNVNVNTGASVNLTATNQYICEGISTTLTANVTGVNGVGNLTYTWTKNNNGTITAITANSPSILATEAGTYTVGVGSSNGICFLGNGNMATITIQEAQIPNVTVSHTTSAGCSNTGTAQLSITNFDAVGYNLYGDVSLANTITLDELSAGSYNITVASEHNHNCFSTTPITIAGSDITVSATTTSPSSCNTPTGAISITPTGGDGSYTVNLIDGNNIVTSNVGNSANNLAPGIYTIHVTDGANCTATTTVTVGTTPVNYTINLPTTQLCPNQASSLTISATATENLTYEWFGDADQTGPSVNITSPGTYQVKGSHDGCSHTQTFTIAEASPVGITISTDGQQCQGEAAAVTATLAGGSYDNITWTNATPETDPLTATVTTFPSTISATIQVGGCSYQSNELTIASTTAVTSTLAASNHYDDTQNCQFTSQASGGTAPYTYNWYLQGQTITTNGDPSDPNDNGSTQTNQEILQVSFFESTPITNLVDGTYSFQIVDANGCSSPTYGPITYTVPENTAAYPAFSFVWGEEALDEDEEDEEIDQNLRENMAEAADAVMAAAGTCYQNNVAAALTNFRRSCFQDHSLKDELSLSYDENIHHYTLFYYDRAGQLTQTVPPEGVDILNTTQTEAILAYRQGTATLANTLANNAMAAHQELLPNHSLRTHYWYNNLGQMIRQHTPDGGNTNFIYDQLSRLRFSQNAQQAQNNTYSYTKYDALGRVVEAGQSSQLTYTDPTANSTHTLDFNNTYSSTNAVPAQTLSFPSTQTQQVTYSVYTTPTQETYYGQAQRYLQNRISYVYSDYDGNLTTTEDQYHTYYSYDPHGNVEWIIQDDPEIGKNYLAYQYDLISGKVLKVSYNEQRADRFYHRYQYDAENRLTSVETSINGEVWDQDASYAYYEHGPLMRTTIGEDQVQGVDYAYTIQGWLKAMNTPQLHRGANTMHNDGSNVTTAWETQHVAKDTYGMSLGYYQGDYKNTTHNYLTDNTNSLYTNAKAKDLYNGNISHWINSRLQQDNTGVNTSINQADHTNATIYRYDILNRIKESWNYEQTNNQLTNGFQAGYTNDNGHHGTLAFHTNYSYDGNGNLTTLKRHNQEGTVMDDLAYSYNRLAPQDPTSKLSNNRLKEVADVAHPSTGTLTYNNVEDIIGERDYSDQDYDAIGNLIHEEALEWISGQKCNVTMDIEWNVSGKIKTIQKTIHKDGIKVGLSHIHFDYDALGNRTRKTAKETLDFSANYTNQTPANYTYGVGDIKTTYYVRDAQGNPMAVYTKKYDTDDNTATLWVEEQAIYGSDRVGLYSRPQLGEPLAEVTLQNGAEATFVGAVETGVEAITAYQNWITTSILPKAAMENLCQCDIKKLNGGENSPYTDAGTLAQFLGIADQGIAIAENTNHETQFYAVLAKNYLGNQDACLVYDQEGKLMKGLEQITDVNTNSRPVIVNLTGSNKYALITLTNQGIPTYHTIDMDQYGYGGANAAGAVTSAVNQPLTSLTNTTGVQYGYHYTGYEDHINNKTIVYTTRSQPLAGQSEKLVEVLAIELNENAPITEHVLWSTTQCGDGDMGELQIAPNGEKLVWHNHSKKIAGFDHKTTTIYEIALNSDKITSTGISANVTTTGGSYAPQAGIAYQEDSENLLYTQHDLYNATNNTSGGKLWKYDQLNLTSLPLSQNLVYLLGDIKRGVNGNLYIPNVYESGADLHHYSTQNGVTTTSNIFSSSTTEERLSGTLPTQV